MVRRKYTDEEELKMFKYYKKYGMKKTKKEFQLKQHGTLYRALKRHNIELNGHVPENHPKYKGGLVEIICVVCGKHKPRKPSQVNKYPCCDKKCAGILKEKTNLGENNPNYRDGFGINVYLRKGYKKIKVKALERDNHKCQMCISDPFDPNGGIITHHIKTVKNHLELFYDINNIITLCRHHHGKIHRFHKEEEYEEFFYSLIKKRGN